MQRYCTKACKESCSLERMRACKVSLYMQTYKGIIIMNHGSGSYVGMTQRKHGRPYVRADCIFAEI